MSHTLDNQGRDEDAYVEMIEDKQVRSIKKQVFHKTIQYWRNVNGEKVTILYLM